MNFNISRLNIIIHILSFMVQVGFVLDFITYYWWLLVVTNEKKIPLVNKGCCTYCMILILPNIIPVSGFLSLV